MTWERFSWCYAVYSGGISSLDWLSWNMWKGARAIHRIVHVKSKRANEAFTINEQNQQIHVSKQKKTLKSLLIDIDID